MESEAHVVLSGSGVRFPVFVGALEALGQAGVTVRQVVGTSGGALVGAFFKVGVPLDEIRRLVENTDFRSVASWSLLGLALLPIRGYVNGGEPLRALLRRYFGARTFADVPEFGAVVSDLTHEQTLVCHASTTPTLSLVDGVYASAATPVVFEPFSSERGVWVDGTVRYDFALDWPHLHDGRPVLGVKVRSPYSAPRSNSALQIVLATVANLIDANDRKHIDDATYARYVDVTSPVHSFDFSVNRAQRQAMVQAGFEAVWAGLADVLAAARVHAAG
ncbi:MAG TPA: patatin-like phospholipase family protein [Polyangia bacterium]|nr:patatin-like phospholipase family protein [Polyangia bacterium]